MSLTSQPPLEVALAAKSASHVLATLPADARNDALTAMHAKLSTARDDILAANKRDLERVREQTDSDQSMLARLDLGKKGKWDDMLKGILDVRELEDPIGQVTLRTKLDDDLILERFTCPIGVLLIIFEARPEVIANISALAIKSGNAAILKGGKESTESFRAIANVISEALSTLDVPNDAIQLVTTREEVGHLLSLDKHIDLVIPRGGNELVRMVKETTRIPVLGHADGVCSIFLEQSADPAMAVNLVVDSKTSYPAACNSVETLLVQEAGLNLVFVPVARALVAKGVSLRCDPKSLAVLKNVLSEEEGTRHLAEALDADYDTEFLKLELAVKVVKDITEAIAHINMHGSRHTDAIVTSSADIAKKFTANVDSAGVFWNASTRMADGMRYGFGTEVGISTNKFHARGPVGLGGLTIYKYVVCGTGHVTASYGVGEGKKPFKHEELPLSR